MPVEQTTATFDVTAPRPPPPLAVERPRTHAHAGKASPPNLKAIPTALVQPPVAHIVPPVIVAAPIAGPGAAASSGASDRAGPGFGAGGNGNGRGSGDDGNGDGDGGEPPRHVSGRIKNADYPHDLVGARIGGTVGVRYRVEVDGRVSDCLVTATSGSAELDALTCRLIQQRFRFRPSLDEDGRPVASQIVENHSWIVDPATDEDRDAR
ncbi:energy transducer TonB [Sphingomonas nostoxanthinifaciens]|nr:energy transducer TonB [Sphingomonas nostoxanthinifaciens]